MGNEIDIDANDEGQCSASEPRSRIAFQRVQTSPAVTGEMDEMEISLRGCC